MKHFVLLRLRESGGFTLVELIIVLVIVGVVGSMSTMLIIRPIQGYAALSRRASLVNTADNALRRMQRDVRAALPNSLRILETGGTSILELLHTRAGGRYRAQSPGDILNFSAPDADFDIIGELSEAPADGQFLVVANLSATAGANNAYLSLGTDNRARISGASTASLIALSEPHQFPLPDANRRFFVVDEAVSYVCDSAAGTLVRHAGYAIQNPQSAGFSGGSSALMADKLSSCRFDYQDGLLRLKLTVEQEGEAIHLLQQVFVVN